MSENKKNKKTTFFILAFLVVLIIILLFAYLIRDNSKKSYTENNSENKNFLNSLVIDIPVASFYNYEIEPQPEGVLAIDQGERLSFKGEKRNLAQVIWFRGAGFFEYKIKNPFKLLEEIPEIKEADIFFEACSEEWKSKLNHYSDISVYLNNNEIGTITLKNDYGGERRGKYPLPSWWPLDNTQYGEKVLLKIKENGTYLQGSSNQEKRISNFKITDIDFTKPDIYLKISVNKNAKNKGGINIFGEKVGDFNKPFSFSIKYKGKKIYQPKVSEIIDNPTKFNGKNVLLGVYFSGWRCPNNKIAYPSFLSRSASFYYDETGCIYGGDPIVDPGLKGINKAYPPLDKESVFSIFGKIKLDKDGIPYIETIENKID